MAMQCSMTAPHLPHDQCQGIPFRPLMQRLTLSTQEIEILVRMTLTQIVYPMHLSEAERQQLRSEFLRDHSFWTSRVTHKTFEVWLAYRTLMCLEMHKYGTKETT